MAVGDVINGISAANTTLDFQPAAGVECVIKSHLWSSLNSPPGLFDGTNLCNVLGSATYTINLANISVFINNSKYWRVPAQGASQFGGYTGVQTK